jgi:hypothetical protein
MPHKYQLLVAGLILFCIGLIITAFMYNPIKCTDTASVMKILETNNNETIVLLEGNAIMHLYHSAKVGDEVCVNWAKNK